MSEQRTCTNGALSGSYQNNSCAVNPAPTPATGSITADSAYINVGQSTVIHARFTAGTNDAPLCSDITTTPGGAGLIGPCTPYNKDYTFTPTTAGTYTFNAEARTTTYSTTYHLFGTVTVNVGAAPVATSGTIDAGSLGQHQDTNLVLSGTVTNAQYPFEIAFTRDGGTSFHAQIPISAYGYSGAWSYNVPNYLMWGSYTAIVSSAGNALANGWLFVTPTPLQCSARTSSGPIKVTADGQVIENLIISSDGSPGIDVDGHSGVVIRNVEIHHRGSSGIRVRYANNTTIRNVDIINSGAPQSGMDSSPDSYNIECGGSSGLSVTHARVSDGVSNISLTGCNSANLQYIEGHNSRGTPNGTYGPFSGGGFFQTNGGTGVVLEDFSIENDPRIAENGDIINVYNSSNVTIRRGRLNGGDAPTERNAGSLVMDTGTHDVVVQDIDVTNATTCGGAWGEATAAMPYRNSNIVFTRIGCRDGVSSRPDGQPTAFGWGFAFHPNVIGSSISDSHFFNIPVGREFLDYGNLHPAEVTQQDFTPRAPQRVQYCI